MYSNYDTQYYDFMRQRKEAADREWSEMISARQHQRLSPQPIYQSGPTSQYNAFRADVSSPKEADDYPINKDGMEMFLVDEANGIIYLKSLNLGTGRWGLEIFEKRVEEVPSVAEPVAEEVPNPILETLAQIREEFGQLRADLEQLKDTVDDLPKELIITANTSKSKSDRPNNNRPKTLQEVVDDVTQKGNNGNV